MMQIKCEMCGSSDLAKEDSLYVCKHCGMKYSPEEAKKMMVEIEGAVKIDDTEELANLYVLARRAKENKNFTDAWNHYNTILAKDPMSWEAVFFSFIFDHTERVLAETEESCQKLLNGISSIIVLVKDTVKDDEERKNAYHEIARYTAWATRNIFSGLQRYEDIFRERRCQILTYLHNILYTFANEMRSNYVNDEYIESIMLCIKQGVQFQAIKINGYLLCNNEDERKIYFGWANDVKQYDPTYVVPEIPALTGEQITLEQQQREAEEQERRCRELKQEEIKSKKSAAVGCIILIIIAALAFFFGPTIIGWLLNLILGGIGSIFGI